MRRAINCAMPAPALRRSAHPVTWLLLACACPSGAGAVMPLPTRPTRAPLVFAAARPGRWRFGHLPPVACEQPRLPQSGGSTGSVPPRGKSTVRTSSDRAGARKRAPQQKKPTVVGSAALGAPERPTKRSESFLRNFLPALVLFFWVRTCVVEPFFIPSLSMVPTLTPNDQIAVEKFSKIWATPRRGELVVFRAPAEFFRSEPGADTGGGVARRIGGGGSSTTLIKRVVAVAGDTVEVKGGTLYLNGQPRYEPYTLEPTRYDLPKLTVPEGSLFVLGDNRNVSVDSHVWGCLSVDNVVGKAFYVLYPVARQGFVDEFMRDLKVTGDTGAFIERLVDEQQPQPRRPPSL